MALFCYVCEVEVIILEEEINEYQEIYHFQKNLPSHLSTVSPAFLSEDMYNSRVPTRGTFPARSFCGCGLERGSAPDPPLRNLSSGTERSPAD